jgi:glutaminase
LLERYARFAGRTLRIDPEVEASERATGHRNRAIGHLLRASGALDGDADEAVERYFAQCAVDVTAADLAVIAATLANGGVNPLTGERAASAETVRSVLAVMSTCGMYDGAGEWLYAIGLPAKSGVSGGILAVVPGRMGLGFFSPPLDPQGNSVRGGLACRDIVRELDLHPLGASPQAPDSLRCAYTVAQVASKRRRSPKARAALLEGGNQALVIELQGRLSFLASESVGATIRVAASQAGRLESVVLDLRRVDHLDPAALHLLAAVIRELEAGDGRVFVSGATRLAAMDRLAELVPTLRLVGELDAAIELAEDAVLALVGHVADEVVAATNHPVLAGLSQTDRIAVLAAAEVRAYGPGSSIVSVGDPSDEIFFVLAGRLSVTIPAEGGARRLSTLEAGMLFGETALLGGGRRTADVRADGPVSCLVLSAAAFEAVAAERPAAAIAVLRHLLGTATATSGRLTREMAVLAG